MRLKQSLQSGIIGSRLVLTTLLLLDLTTRKTSLQTVRINPLDAEAYTHLGVAYTYLKDYRKAAEAFRQVVKLRPKEALAHFNTGFEELKSNHSQLAVKSFQEAIKLDPKWPALTEISVPHTIVWAVAPMRSKHRSKD